jgi:hypothetical protein
MPLLPGYFCGPTKFSRDKRIVIGHQRSLIVPKQAADDSSPGAQFRIRGFDSLLGHRFRSHSPQVRKAAFDGRNRAFRVRACARAEATTMIDIGIFLTLQRFNELTWRRQCWL